MVETPQITHAIEPRRSSRALLKAIFDADHPEQFIRTIPAQSLYIAARQMGLETAASALEIASIEQCRLVLDFDLWDRDLLSEERFWEWLSLTDEQGDFTLLQKVLKSLDLKIVGLIISRYVESITFDEGTDSPPQEGFYTPDKGHTWIHLKLPDNNRHFLLARFLALIFETSPDLFYQLLSIPGVATSSGLEEEAYQDRQKRMLAEGLPDPEFSAQVLAPVHPSLVPTALKNTEKRGVVEGVRAIEPLVYDTPNARMLRELLEAGGENLEEELTLVINAAIVHFRVDFAETDELIALAARVKGAICIGLEVALRASPKSNIRSIYESLGLSKIFGLGFHELLEIKKGTKLLSQEKLKGMEATDPLFSIVAGLRETFPRMPRFVLPDGSFEEQEGKLTPGYKAIESLEEIAALTELLRKASS